MIVVCTWGEYVCTWFMWGSLLTCMYVGASHESHKSHVTSQPNTIWTKSRVQVEFGVGWRFLDPNNISCVLSHSRTAHFFIPNNVWTKYSFGWYLKLRKHSRTGSYMSNITEGNNVMASACSTNILRWSMTSDVSFMQLMKTFLDLLSIQVMKYS